MEQTEWLVVRRNSWCTVDNILIRAGREARVDSSDGRSSSIRCAKSLESFLWKSLFQNIYSSFVRCLTSAPIAKSYLRNWNMTEHSVQMRASPNTFWDRILHFCSCTRWQAWSQVNNKATNNRSTGLTKNLNPATITQWLWTIYFWPGEIFCCCG